MITGLDDFRDVPFVARTPNWMASFVNGLHHRMVQSLIIHPDWTLDTFLAWLVNDEFVNEVDILGAFGGRVNDIPVAWEKAKKANNLRSRS